MGESRSRRSSRSALSARERKRLIECVQYLNLAEMREFCGAHRLPLHIHVRRPDGRLKKTSDRDRKDVVLDRILQWALRGRRTGPTVYEPGVVATGPLPSGLTPRTRIRYGQYEKKNAELVEILQDLTDGAFRLGMIARLVLRDFWSAGRAPTLKQFAGDWVRATAAHTSPRPEGAYLADLARGAAGPGWKQVRIDRAREALGLLDELLAGRAS